MEKLEELQAKIVQFEQREKELEQRVEELTDFVENASIPLHWVNSEGKIIWANQAELDSLGYSKEEYIGHSISDFHADSEVINDILSRLMNNETLHNYQAKLKCKNGEVKHVLISSNVLNKDGKFIHTRCFTRDISDLKKEEERKQDLINDLEKSEARLRMAIEATHLGTWDYYPLSGELNWSEECKRIYGYHSNESIDIKAFEEHIHPEDRDFALKAIDKAMDPSGEGKYEVVYRIIRFDDQGTRSIKAQGKVYFNSDRQAYRFIGTVVDITESNQVLEKLVRSEKLFKSIALNIPKSLILVIDKDHKFVTIEGDLMEKMGYESKNYEGKHPTEVAPPERYEATKHLYEQVLAGEKFSVERKSQTGEDYMVHFVPLKDDNEKVYAGLIIALDVSDIKQAEEQSAKLAAIVESSGDAIIGKSLDGIIISWNESAERMFGYKAEEIINQPSITIIPEDRHDEETQIFTRIRNGERVEHFETQRITKDRRLLDISLTISAIKDAKGNIIGLSKIARDIAEQKQAERQLLKSEEQLRLAIKAADLGTFDMDLIQGTMDWDTRCRELFGIYNISAVNYNKDFLNGLHEDDLERVSKLVERVLDRNQSDGSYDVEYRTVGIEDKKLRWIRAMGQAFFDENDKPTRFIGAVLDISDKKQEELKKNDFIAIISHELKTPLTTVKSYLQILLAKAKIDGDNFTLNALTRAEIQATKMTSMIQDFLSLARLEDGKIRLNKEPFKLQPYIEDIVSDAQFFTTIHTIQFNSCKDIMLNADKDKIGQVVINLLSNAIKYSPNGGTITIGCELHEGKVKVSVSDEGVGISKNDQKRLFDRFYRVQNEKVKTISGVGIGLYFVSEILHRHRSKIEVESEEGVGSTFYFSLDEY